MQNGSSGKRQERRETRVDMSQDDWGSSSFQDDTNKMFSIGCVCLEVFALVVFIDAKAASTLNSAPFSIKVTLNYLVTMCYFLHRGHAEQKSLESRCEAAMRSEMLRCLPLAPRESLLVATVTSIMWLGLA